MVVVYFEWFLLFLFVSQVFASLSHLNEVQEHLVKYFNHMQECSSDFEYLHVNSGKHIKACEKGNVFSQEEL